MTPGARRSADQRFRAVLFDFDRTLFRFDDSIDWLRVALDRLDRTVDPPDILALYERIDAARSSPEVLRRLCGCQRCPITHRRAQLFWFRRAGADDALADALYRRLTDPDGWTPYSDTVSTMMALRQRGVPLAIVSNVGWDIRPTFEHHGLGGLVTTFALSCEHGSEKPDSTLFVAACAALGAVPNEVLMVGDDPINDSAGVRLGMHVFLLPDRPLGACRGLAPVIELTASPAPCVRRAYDKRQSRH
jgi:HAD superfamily hydrolase (TIGR01549 family)